LGGRDASENGSKLGQVIFRMLVKCWRVSTSHNVIHVEAPVLDRRCVNMKPISISEAAKNVLVIFLKIHAQVLSFVRVLENFFELLVIVVVNVELWSQIDLYLV